jgi:hypothetical protein
MVGGMKTLLQNLQTLFRADASVTSFVDSRNIRIGSDTIDQLVQNRRFPFVVVDEAPDVPEVYRPTDVGRWNSRSGPQPLRGRVFNIIVRFAVRIRSKDTALLGDEGILEINDVIMDVIFNNPTVSGRVEQLSEDITVRRAEVYSGNTFLGIAREVNLTYYGTDEYS